jgi:putative heme iron utilization protein
MLLTLRDKFPYFGHRLRKLKSDLAELQAKYAEDQHRAQSELSSISNKLIELERENEFVLVQLFQAQSDLDKPSAEAIALQEKIEEQKLKKNKLEIALIERENEVQALSRKIEEISKENLAFSEQYNRLEKINNDLQNKLTDFARTNESYELLKINYKQLEKDFLEKSNALKNDFELLISNKDEQFEGINKENDRLLFSLHKAQENLETVYMQTKTNEHEISLHRNRWERIGGRFPEYVDFSSAKVSIRELAGQEQVIWDVLHYSQSQQFIDSLPFVTLLINGIPGLSILDKEKPFILYPSMLSKSGSQLDQYSKLSYEHVSKLQAAINVVNFALSYRWTGMTLSKDFDGQFWYNSLKTLVQNFKSLPPVFRIGSVKLKLEVQNIDYEHLWLEMFDVSYGKFFAPKIEIRIGAASIEKNEFSKLPKIEIPLVDGIGKPFDSWYPESSDTFGQKLEFRFDLDGQVMDTVVWSKLATEDISLCMSMLQALPGVLMKLQDEKISTKRPWSVWIDFIEQTLTIISKARSSASKKTEEIPEIYIESPIQTMKESKKLDSKTASKRVPAKKIKSITVTSKKKASSS